MVIPPCAGDCSTSSFVFREEARCRSSGKMPSSWYSTKRRIGQSAATTGHLAGSARGKILLKSIARRLSEYCERVRILSEEQSGCRPNRSTTDMMFVNRRIQELALKKLILLYVCFINLTKVYDSVDQTLLWTVLTRFGVPQNIISAIRQFHDGMRACVRLDDRVCSRWFGVEHGLRQGCVLAPLLLHLVCGSYKRGLHAFQGGQRHHGRFGAPEEEKGGGGAGGSNFRRVSPRDAAMGHVLC